LRFAATAAVESLYCHRYLSHRTAGCAILPLHCEMAPGLPFAWHFCYFPTSELNPGICSVTVRRNGFHACLVPVNKWFSWHLIQFVDSYQAAQVGFTKRCLGIPELKNCKARIYAKWSARL